MTQVSSRRTKSGVSKNNTGTASSHSMVDGKTTEGNGGKRKIVPLYKSLQFYWFIGHFLTMVHFVFYSIPFNVLVVIGPYYHQVGCLLSILVTYMIVIVQFFKYQRIKGNNEYRVQFNKAFVGKIINIDNVQYFLMTLIVFFISLSLFNQKSEALKIIPNSILLSPTIFSLFHCLNYIYKNQDSIIYRFSSASAGSVQETEQKKLKLTHYVNCIADFIDKYNEKGLLIAHVLQCTTLFQFLIRLLTYLPVKLLIVLLKTMGNYLFHSISSVSGKHQEEQYGSIGRNSSEFKTIYLQVLLSLTYVWFFKMRLRNADQKLLNICILFNSQFLQLFEKYIPSFVEYYMTLKSLLVEFFNRIPV